MTKVIIWRRNADGTRTLLDVGHNKSIQEVPAKESYVEDIKVEEGPPKSPPSGLSELEATILQEIESAHLRERQAQADPDYREYVEGLSRQRAHRQPVNMDEMWELLYPNVDKRVAAQQLVTEFFNWAGLKDD